MVYDRYFGFSQENNKKEHVAKIYRRVPLSCQGFAVTGPVPTLMPSSMLLRP